MRSPRVARKCHEHDQEFCCATDLSPGPHTAWESFAGCRQGLCLPQKCRGLVGHSTTFVHVCFAVV